MANDESLDQEIDQEIAPTPFISKALIGRVLAVGVFVALGTFAVVQSISGKPAEPGDLPDDSAIVAKATDKVGDAVNTVAATGKAIGGAIGDAAKSASESAGAAGDKAKRGLGDFLAGTRDQAKNPVNKADPFKAKVNPSGKSSFDNSLRKPSPKPSVASVSTSSSGFNAAKPPTNRPLIKPIGKPVSRPTADPVVKKIAPGFSGAFAGTGSLKPANGTFKPASPAAPKPPERLAQNGGFLPKAGRGSLGVPTPPQTRSAPPLPGFNPTGATSAAGGSFNQLKNSIKSETQALSQNAANNFNSSTDKLKSLVNSTTETTRSLGNQLSNRLGGVQAESKPSTNQGFVGAPKSSNASGTKPFERKTFQSKPIASQRSGGNQAPFSAASRASQSSRNAGFTSKPPVQRPDRPRVEFGGLAGNKSFSGKPDNASRFSRGTKPPTDLGGAARLRPQPKPQPTKIVSTRQSFSKPQSQPAQPAKQGGSSSRLAGSQTRASSAPGERQLDGVQAPSLTIEKVSPREIQVGQDADFEIRVRNVGRVAAESVTVIDRVPAGTEFIGASPEPQRGARSGALEWQIGTLTPGQEKRIRYQLKPTQPGEIGSVAQVFFAAQASMRTLVTRPVLNIQHDTSPKMLMGDNFVFDVLVENRGDGPANDVIIQEEVPTQLEYEAGFRQLEYEVGTLLPGQKKKLRLALRAGKVGKFRNVMFATGRGGLEASHALDLEVVAPEIHVTSSGPKRRFLQRKATHQFTIENRGTARATNVGLVARLPSGLRYVDADNRGRYDSQSHAVYWKMPELTDGVAGTVEVTTVPINVGQQNIKFEADADLKLFASAEQELLVKHLVDVFFEIDDVIDPIEVGSQTSYRMRVVNQGTKAASNVQLKLDFPQGLEPEQAEGNLRHQIQGQQVIFEPISSLPPGQEVNLSVRATGKSPGDLRVVANIRADGREVVISKEETTRVYSDR